MATYWENRIDNLVTKRIDEMNSLPDYTFKVPRKKAKKIINRTNKDPEQIIECDDSHENVPVNIDDLNWTKLFE